MIHRQIWVDRIERAWRQAPIVWLSGVRRVGKTTLARTLAGEHYFNCDLPSVAARTAEPERFWASQKGRVVVLDEVHQLPDPSRLLKIAADAYPGLRVLATGSSTLAATRKFRDALTGRKREVVLLPVLAEETDAFGANIEQRLHRGGLPPALLAERSDPELYAEWLDSFFARDVQELFRIGKRTAFLRVLETLLRQSGGLLDVSSLSRTCDVSRPTALGWLEALQVMHAIHVVRPFHGGGTRELVRQPKVYGFDTGFVAHVRGWDRLRTDDCGPLWEHLVRDTLASLPGGRAVQFWRDKAKREVDFVVPRGRASCDAIECKWSAAAFDPGALKAFRALHPSGRNLVVTPDPGDPYERRLGGLTVTFCGAVHLRGLLG
ncbi:MAG: ATP-binding protein [Deltaproteobacteria bacterium]|nr:ATP-binding protein [Deltaproteobacteria bacterium]